jgi:site-specific DNA recombinase
MNTRAALYARFSTEKQSEASIDDQFRVCERLAERHSFGVVARYSDQAISGGTTQRPGYQQLLRAARRHEFDAVIAEDTSRLWRNLAEQAPRLAELADLGIAVVTHDLDTRHESADIMGAVGGAMASAYRKEIGRRTRRGLEGIARSGNSAGGRAYGYVSAAESMSHRREIEPIQAAIVREIFLNYGSGWSPRAIAAELNRRGVPSPGSVWNRQLRRKGGWMMSAIAGDPKRAIGILNNEIYIGRVVWNRVRWVRSAADSSKRRCVVNPPSEWIVREDESLQIVPQPLWDAVKHRQAGLQARRGERVKAGLAAAQARSPGPGPRYLLSGLLKCGTCGASFVMADRAHYACATRVHGGPDGCSNDYRAKRLPTEAGVLVGTKREMLAPDVVAEAKARIMRALKAGRRRPAVDPKRLKQLEQQVMSLVDAIASGALAASPAIAERLKVTEAELAHLRERDRSTTPLSTIEAIVPRLEEHYVAKVKGLEATLASGDIAKARTELLDVIGEIDVMATAEEVKFMSRKGAAEYAIARVAGLQQINLVAGAGFEPATFGL